ncbi:heat shock protein [Aspergillus rambellii]|uniref:Heat shock protein n=1 Tax=Aspergillus rambellii TaxID=308745 RepID=A0A0F8WT36_9EURO|nr:heat shock protein [Aspergillus rambellii]
MSLFRSMPTAGDFSPLFRLLDDYDVHRSSRGQPTAVRTFAPRFDVRETEDTYHLDGELPGIAQNDIDIEFTDPQTLVIKGHSEREYHAEAPPEAEEEEEEEAQGKSSEVIRTSGNKPRFWVSERSVGEFQRTFNFPTRVNQDNVKANLKNGILSVSVPKAAAPSLKKITIQ